ncbi:YLP motif-containing protein 1-like [Senna tora]|uniref:YLP motif-containing protein 1-like n=1 Tax=Senna tora TaxID=362788 RepID=A0A834U246_9FABA|nr:YLP motif-containing protein 1-like [Senna tora]
MMKEEGGFIMCGVLEKEGCIGNNSWRVMYYGEASASMAVPFMWESKPGTPKHLFYNSQSHTSLDLPPLTPPPSYHYFNNNNHSNPTKPTTTTTCSNNNNNKARIFHSISIFRAPLLAGSGKFHHVSSSSSSSSSSSFSVRHRSDHDEGFRGCNPFGNIRSKFLKFKIVGHGGSPAL